MFERKLENLEKSIGYTFNDIELLKLALSHSSMANERVGKKIQSNERIEFLGDAVLELVSSDFLYKTFPNKTEGELTKLRAGLVCEPSLAADAREIQLQDYIMLGVGEEKTGGRQRDSIVSDAFESVIGAIYMDGGLAPASDFIHRFVLTDVEKKTLFHDSKSLLQEFVQNKIKKTIRYEILSESGPDHDKCFVAQVFIGDEGMKIGTGKTKKAAEQQAAYETLISLKL